MKNILFSIGKTGNKKKLLPFIVALKNADYTFYATEQTHEYLKSKGVNSTLVYKPSQKSKKPNVIDLLKNKVFDLIIDIPTHTGKNDYEPTDGLYIRGTALETGITLITEVDSVEKVLRYLQGHSLPAKIKKTDEIDKLVQKYRPLLHKGFSIPSSKWSYDISKSYDWNFEHGPQFSGEFPKRVVKPVKQFLSFKVNSLFGVPAGPLLNSHWIELYAKLGFDILTYKSLRTRSYPAFPMPHMLYVEPKNNQKDNQSYIGRPYSSKYEALAMTNSFGVPSKDPDVWQEDIERTLSILNEGQLLIVSVMGTREAAKTEQEFIDDYAKCAMLALDAGAPVIEINLSCPNLHGSGIVCYDIALVEKICYQVKNAIGNTPLIAKIGFYPNEQDLRIFVSKTNKYLDGIAVINTIRGDITDVQFKKPIMRYLESSGICGQLIRPYGLAMVELLHRLRREWNLKFSIIGIGGVTTPEDYEDYILAGADAVQSATGAMMDPLLAYKIYEREVAQKQNYSLTKSLGPTRFDTIIGSHTSDMLKKMYYEMVFPKNKSLENHTLLINDKPFDLKHGERGRKSSHIYMNHRVPLLVDAWDRRLLAKTLDQLIRENVPGAQNGYGVIAVPASSSPELTATMLDLFPDSVSRTVVLFDHIIEIEKGAHTFVYGDIDILKPWVLIDDVFTSGGTFRKAIQKIMLQLGSVKTKQLKLYAATLISRNPEEVEKFTRETHIPVITVSNLNEVLSHHWKQFSQKQKQLVQNERQELG